MTYAASSIWVTDPYEPGHGLVQRVDPATNALLGTISFATSKAETCGNVVGDAGAVWFTSGCDNTYVARIDPQTNQIAATINMGAGERTHDIALGFGSVWVTTLSHLSRIDPATNKIVATTILPATAVATGAGSIWVGNAMTLDRVTPG
jgi:virginiamycin B lyase